MKKLYGLLLLVGSFGIVESASVSRITGLGSRLAPAVRGRATDLGLFKPQSLSSRFGSGSQSRLFSTTPKTSTFTARSVPKVGPSLSQQAALLARKYYKPAAALGAGAVGTYLGSRYVSPQDLDMDTFRPSMVLAEEVDPTREKIENMFTRAQLNEGTDSKLLEDWVKLAWDLFGENLTKEDKKRFAQASAKVFDMSKSELGEVIKPVPGKPQFVSPGVAVELFIPFINLASGTSPYKLHEFGTPRPFGTQKDPNFPGPEHVDTEKGFYIPTALVEILKSRDKMKETLQIYKEKLLDPDARKRNSGEDEVLPSRLGPEFAMTELETNSPTVQKRVALIDALIDLVEAPINTYEQEPGLIWYKKSSSWIPWNWLGY